MLSLHFRARSLLGPYHFFFSSLQPVVNQTHHTIALRRSFYAAGYESGIRCIRKRRCLNVPSPVDVQPIFTVSELVAEHMLFVYSLARRVKEA